MRTRIAVLFALSVAVGACTAAAAPVSQPQNPNGGGSTTQPAATTTPSPPPAVVATPTDAPSPTSTPGLDYQGDWNGGQTAGVIKRCASSTPGFWIGDVRFNNGDMASISFQFADGTSTAPVHIDTPPVVKSFEVLVKGAGEFVNGDQPTFLLKIGDGSYTIKLETGQFCKH